MRASELLTSDLPMRGMMGWMIEIPDASKPSFCSLKGVSSLQYLNARIFLILKKQNKGPKGRFHEGQRRGQSLGKVVEARSKPEKIVLVREHCGVKTVTGHILTRLVTCVP